MLKQLKPLLTLIICATLVFFSCKPPESTITKEQMVKDFYTGYNSGDFNLLSKHISDSIVYSDQGFLIAANLNDLRTFFQWDSVFKPHYGISELKEDSNSVTLNVNKLCKRINFLQDTATSYKVKVDFINDQIASVQITEQLYFNSEKWLPRRDSLLSWIDKTHPELSGFFNQPGYTGAEKFLKAMELYNEAH